ncbi:MAG: DUF3800 domain-containing protein [Acidobacteria bacterium]|nr:DUF3800 domain-containing protein [Acidobacteriota bacterium]
MYLLYIDESGNAFDASDRHFVLAGIAVFERRTYWMQRDAELIKATHFPTAPPLDFHAQPIKSGHGFWRRVDADLRQTVLCEIGNVITNAPAPEAVLFGAVVEKNDTMHGADAIRLALEQVTKRFDTLLARKAKRNNPQRGLIVLAQSQYEQHAKTWLNEFRGLGTQWGVLNNLADIPFTAPAKETRMLQLADYVAHALFLLYERRDPTLIKPVIDRFDCTQGTYHGLVHVSDNRGKTCGCPACCTRHKPGSRSLWLHSQPKSN